MMNLKDFSSSNECLPALFICSRSEDTVLVLLLANSCQRDVLI